MPEEYDEIELPRFARPIAITPSPVQGRSPEAADGPIGVLPSFTGLLGLRVESGERALPALSYLVLRPLAVPELSGPEGGDDTTGGTERAASDGTDTGTDLEVYQILGREAGEEPGREASSRRPVGDVGNIGERSHFSDYPRTLVERRDTGGRWADPSTGRPGAEVVRSDSGTPWRSAEDPKEKENDQRGPNTAVEPWIAPREERPDAGSDLRELRSRPTREEPSEDRDDRPPASERNGIGAATEQREGSADLDAPTMTVPRTMTTIDDVTTRRTDFAPLARGVETTVPGVGDRRSRENARLEGDREASSGVDRAASAGPEDSVSESGPELTVRRAGSNYGGEYGEHGDTGRSQRSQRETERVERQDDVPSRTIPSLGRDVDLDRLVDRLYQALERKMRVERERRGL